MPVSNKAIGPMAATNRSSRSSTRYLRVRRLRRLGLSGQLAQCQIISTMPNSTSMPYSPRMRHQISRYVTTASSRMPITSPTARL
jgi:hypothetical protein